LQLVYKITWLCATVDERQQIDIAFAYHTHW